MRSFEPCPNCEKEHATRVRFTPWGGVIGPRVFSLVRCGGCGEQYNGKSGRQVKKAIRIYTCVTLCVLAVMVALAIYTLASGAAKEGRGQGTGLGSALVG